MSDMRQHEKELRVGLEQTRDYLAFKEEAERFEEWLVEQLRSLAAAEQADEQRLRLGAGSLDSTLIAFPVRFPANSIHLFTPLLLLEQHASHSSFVSYRNPPESSIFSLSLFNILFFSYT